MNIYAFNSEGETDWIFAPNIQEAKEFYLKFTGYAGLGACKITSVPKNKWTELHIIDLNESEPDDTDVVYNEEDYCNGYKIIESFAEYAERHSKTDMIANNKYF